MSSALGEHLGGGVHDLGADRAVIVVGKARPDAGAGLDHDLVAVGDGFRRRERREADPEFLRLDFLRTPDAAWRVSSFSLPTLVPASRRNCFEFNSVHGIAIGGRTCGFP